MTPPPMDPRDRVRRRLMTLSQIAAVAAAPLTNAACDPMPQPYCAEADSERASLVTASATWTEDPDHPGEFVLVFDATARDTRLSVQPLPSLTTGGVVLESSSTDLPWRIRPDEGATEVVLSGNLECTDAWRSGFRATIDVSGTRTEGAAAPVTLVALD